MNQSQLWYLASRLPHPRKKKGRKPYSNIALLPGILQVLRSGCRWRDLDLTKRKNDPSAVTHWRRLQFWRRSQHFSRLWSLILSKLAKTRKLNVQLFAIDGTVIPSFHFKECTGYSGAKKRHGVNVANVVDSSGIPIGFSVAPANTVDISMAEPTLNQIKVPLSFLFKSTLLADKGYDSRSFRIYLFEHCIKPNIPINRRNHQRLSLDYFPRLYENNEENSKKRYVVERTNAWYKSFRRLKFRFDRTKKSFEAFLYLAALVICIKRLL